VNELLICAVMLDSLTVSYVKFVIMLTELRKVLSHVCLCSKITNEPYEKL
jgi:hypothetical protein